MLGETIVFMTDEDFKNSNEACVTVEWQTVGCGDNESEGWCVRVADAGSPTERPVVDEDTTSNGNRTFDTEAEVVEWMKKFGFRPV